MELKKLDKRVLTLWYIHAMIASLILVGVFISALVFLLVLEAPANAMLAVLLCVAIPVFLIVGFTLIMPALRYRMFAWGYDDKRIVVKQGVIFRHRVVIPVCQIQDLHRNQGPLMMLLNLSSVTISTAGSNFDLSTLTTVEADKMIDELERHLEARIEELKNEEI